MEEGKLKYENIVGQKFGKLLVVEEISTEKNGRKRYMVRCKCDCGNETTVEKSHLKAGRTTSCGCVQKEMRKGLGKRFRKPEGESAFNELFGSYKRSAKHRGYPFELTKEEFKEIITQPCIYCGEVLTQEYGKNSPTFASTFKYTGIDRYDNTKGYVKGNCVPCCKVCNRIKTNMPIEDMTHKLEQILSRRHIWGRELHRRDK